MKNLLTLTLLAFALPCGAPLADESGILVRYHAVAVGMKNKHNFGVYVGAPDSYTASNWAISKCEQQAGTPCRIETEHTTTRNQCVAVATARHDNSTAPDLLGLVVGWGEDGNEQRAKDEALSQCRQKGRLVEAFGCSIQIAKCYK